MKLKLSSGNSFYISDQNDIDLWFIEIKTIDLFDNHPIKFVGWWKMKRKLLSRYRFWIPSLRTLDLWPIDPKTIKFFFCSIRANIMCSLKALGVKKLKLLSVNHFNASGLRDLYVLPLSLILFTTVYLSSTGAKK